MSDTLNTSVGTVKVVITPPTKPTKPEKHLDQEVNYGNLTSNV